MFGWDWGPRIPDAGIFRQVSLMGVEEARIGGVYVTQKHEEGKVILHLDVEAESASGGRVELPYTVTLTFPDGEERVYEGSPEEIQIKNPTLWWPNGYGSQPLYGIKLELLGSQGEKDGQGNGTGTMGRVLDVWERRIGLRTMTIRREKDAYGESFAHEVNGVTIFGMGRRLLSRRLFLRCL